MVMLQSAGSAQRLVYDVTDPVYPRLICNISNTSAHLVPDGSVEWLKPISEHQTDVVISSLGGSDSRVGSFPFWVTSGSWLPDLSVMACTRRLIADTSYSNGSIEVWLYVANQQPFFLTRYPIGIGDCICRFGLPPQVLAVSPDGKYLVAGWASGKGSHPLAVFRVSDHSLAADLDPRVTFAFWDRSGHRLFLNRLGSNPTQAWTPEGDAVELPGAASWSYLPGMSPDGSLVAYTAYSDQNFREPRIYLYDFKQGWSTRMLVDRLRTQVLFVKAGWVWYLEERACVPADSCAGLTMPTGNVLAIQLATGAERAVSFAAGEDPLTQAGALNWLAFGPGEFWPPS
jgi:hypothetical protein